MAGSDPADDVGVAGGRALGDEGHVALAAAQRHVDVLAREQEGARLLVGGDGGVAELEAARAGRDQGDELDVARDRRRVARGGVASFRVPR
jgi:hypothetical protein